MRAVEVSMPKTAELQCTDRNATRDKEQWGKPGEWLLMDHTGSHFTNCWKNFENSDARADKSGVLAILIPARMSK